MLPFIKSKIGNNKKLFENFVSLYILQGTNYLLPLITFPYLSRVLGPENFGLISFANAFVAYFTALTDYGFNLSATRQIAIHKTDTAKVSEVFNSVLTIKLLFALISLTILVITISSFEKFERHSELYYVTFGVVIGSVLFPTWFFQGMEEMKYITILNFIFRFISTIGIFALVNKEADYLIVQILSSAGSILIGLIAIIFIKKKYKINFQWAGIGAIYFYLKDGLYIFFTSILTTVYNQSNILLLGIFTNNTIVGYFAIADKLRSIILTMLTPLTSTLYPHLSNLFKESHRKYLKKHTQLFKIYLGLTCVLFITALIFNEQLILIVSGKEFISAVPIFKILIFSILVNGIGHLYTTLFLIVKGDNLKVLRFFSYSLITYIIGISILFSADSLNQFTLSYVLVISELCVVVFAFIYFTRWRKQQYHLLKTTN